MTLYRRLGVKKDATTEQVKRAYRQKAKKLHPDRGGDAEKFREVHIAFEVLSDPERRRRYDETGEYDEIVAPTPAIDPEVNALLYAALMDAVFPDQETPFQPPESINPKKSDIKKRVLKELDKARGLIKEKKKVVNVQIAKFRLMKERFTTEGEFNYFEGVIDANIGNWERGLEQLERQLQKVKEAEDFVEGYKYRTDERTISPFEFATERMLPEATFTFRFAATNEENK